MSPMNVIFIDKQRMFVQGMISLINKTKYPSIKIKGHYNTVEEFKRIHIGVVEVMIIDPIQAEAESLELIEEVKLTKKGTKIILLTMLDNYKYIKQAITKGADGYILKTGDYSEFETCFIEVAEDKTFLGNGVHLSPPASMFKTNFKANDKVNRFEDRYQIRQRLTKREQEILRLITQAKTNDEIGDQLFISDQTVGVHRKNIMRKLGMKTTMTLIKYAIENELV